MIEPRKTRNEKLGTTKDTNEMMRSPRRLRGAPVGQARRLTLFRVFRVFRGSIPFVIFVSFVVTSELPLTTAVLATKSAPAASGGLCDPVAVESVTAFPFPVSNAALRCLCFTRRCSDCSRSPRCR